jgi:hypothetical protein
MLHKQKFTINFVPTDDHLDKFVLKKS